MPFKMIKRTLLMTMLLFTTTFAAGQEATPEAAAEPLAVEVEAADGLMLQASYYAPVGENIPSVLLLHQNQSNRHGWDLLLPHLLSEGYAVVAVDLRGHGETGSTSDWQAAIGDVQTWLDWMRAQPGIAPDAISIIGASIGSNLALVGCGNDPECVTAIALSPSLDYFGVTTSDAVEHQLRRRSALLVTGQNDGQSARGVKELVSLSRGEIGTQFYFSGSHGTGMFLPHGSTLIPLIINWLNAHTPSTEAA